MLKNKIANKWFDGLAIVFILALLSAGLWYPQNLTFLIPKCWVKNWFGFPCPGCGLTSSFMAFSRGHVWEAFKHNAAGPFLYLFFGMVLYEQIRKIKNPSYKIIWPQKGIYCFSLIFMLILLTQWAIKLLIYFHIV